MAADFTKLGSLELTPANGIEVTRHDFPEPKKKMRTQPFIQNHGENIVTALYGNSVRGLDLDITGANKVDLLNKVAIVQNELRKLDLDQSLVLEHKSKDAANSSFSDLLEYDRKMLQDWQYVNVNLAKMKLILPAKPFWHGVLTTITIGPLGQTPVQTTLRDILGDVPSDASLWIKGTGNHQNIYAGIKNKGDLTLVTNFEGTADATAYSGEHKRVSDIGLGFFGTSGAIHTIANAENATGLYRLLGRHKTGDGTPASVLVKLRQEVDGITSDSAEQAPFADANWTWIDYGTINIPPRPTSAQASFTLENYVVAQGTGANADFDTDIYALLPLPAFYFKKATAAASTLLFDGVPPRHVAWSSIGLGHYGQGYWPGKGNFSGSFLQVHPGEDNQLVIVMADATIQEAEAELDYFPQYLTPTR